MDPILERGARQGLVNMLGFKPGNKACIVTDRATMAETGNAFVEVAEAISPGNVRVLLLEDYGERPLATMPPELVEAAKGMDVTMFVAQSLGLELETVRKPFIRAATGGGASHGHCPGFTRQMMLEGMATDYQTVYALSRALSDMLADVHTMNLTTKAGTNLVMNHLRHHPWLPSKPIARGDMGNLPDGEVFCFPADVYGTAVVDGCVGDCLEKYGNLKQTPIWINILPGGIAYEIRCLGSTALENDLTTYVFNLDKQREFLTRKVGEWAQGTNLGLTRPIGRMLQDEKLGIAAHFAFGDPLDNHGTKAGYKCKGHIDCVVMEPTVVADDITIREEGRFTELVLREAIKHLPRGYALAKDGSGFIAPTEP